MRALVGLGLFALVAIGYADPRDFSVDVVPVFESTYSWAGAPVAVVIENRGPDAVGHLFANDEGEMTRYPVELPTGSKKRIVTYPSSTPFGAVPEFLLDTDQGRVRIPFTTRSEFSYGNMSLVAMVSDTSGELAFLRKLDDQPQARENTTFGDAYCTPESAPDRPVGYNGLGAVIIGPGAERLSDGSVKALKTFALTGGTLVFIGGASAAVLSDPRWQDLLPGTNYRSSTIARSQVLSELAGQPMNEAVTVAAGKPKNFARSKFDGSIPMISERGYGLGRVVVFAFNPFEDPLVRWPGRRRLFLQQIRDVDYLRASQFLAQFGNSGYDPYGYGYGSGYASSTPYAYTAGGGSGDPFSIKLPGSAKVFWILAAFFVTVVPLNFLVLRKAGKGEWAWLTAPVISVAFSMIFLNQAGDLYSASLSTATNGVMIVQEGAPEAIFVGTTQMFFPNGGSYDLKMVNVDQLGSGSPEYAYYNRVSNRSQMNPVDVGTVLVPDLRAANLAFEEIAYRQRYATFPRLQVTSKQEGPERTVISVKNTTTSRLRNAAVIVRGTRYPLRDLAPGESQSLEPSMSPATNQSDPLNGVTRRQNIAVVVTDFTQNLRPGPQIGSDVASRTNLRLVYVASLPLGGSGE